MMRLMNSLAVTLNITIILARVFRRAIAVCIASEEIFLETEILAGIAGNRY